MPTASNAAPAPASPLPVIRLTDRQEAFCQAMACNTGGAEAARRAGYSAKGAKQRGALLMRQLEIRVRIDQLRAGRHADHHTLLNDAASQVEVIITDALEKKSCGLALRAIEFRLKLRGAIQDKRIAHHYHIDHGHPDADQENLDPDFNEELDAIGIKRDGKPVAPKASAALAPPAKPAASLPKHPEPKRLPAAAGTRIVTRDSDLSRFLPQPPAAGCLFGSTALTAPVPLPTPKFPRVPVAA